MSRTDEDFGFSAWDADEIVPDKTLDYEKRLYTVHGMIMPLLEKLMENPEKDYIRWPNRKAKLEKLITEINKVVDGH